jgi:hypothetical protein
MSYKNIDISEGLNICEKFFQQIHPNIYDEYQNDEIDFISFHLFFDYIFNTVRYFDKYLIYNNDNFF